MNDFWFYGDFLIEVVDSFQYLGLKLSYTGKFSCAQQDLASKGLRAIYALRNNVSQLVDPDVNMLLNLFDKMVTPVLSYGCEVWGFHTASAIEKVHLKFCKLVLKVSKSTCNEMIYGELERYPLIIERKVKKISYWLKIVHNESSLLVQKVYSLMYVAVTRNAMLENWASLVRKLLCSIACNEVWLQQSVSNRHSFLRQCKQRLRDIYIQNWSEFINLKSSCLLHKNFHVDFKLSKYLILVNAKKHRLALTKFRLKNHKLPNIVKERGGLVYHKTKGYVTHVIH